MYKKFGEKVKIETIIKKVRNDFMALNQKYFDESKDKYDFWKNHISYVLSKALMLAKRTMMI